MRRDVPVAKIMRRPSALIPDDLAEAVLFLQALRQGGLFERLNRWLPLQRRDGFLVGPLLAVFVCFLLSGRSSIRGTLTSWSGPLRRRLAAVAGFFQLPTSSSLSRALGGLRTEQVRPFLHQLLGTWVDARILAHPSVVQRDANGQGWHVIDIDPTVKAVRVRDLPDDEERHPGVRRAPGAPGYVGRKRGEHRIRGVPVLHDGSGLWLAFELVGADGSITPTFTSLLGKAVEHLVGAGISRDRIIVRGDGEFGSADVLRSAIAAGVDIVVRSSRYALLNRESVLAALEKAEWHEVVSSLGSGPRRAADVGMVRLLASTGSDAEVTVRLVATATPTSRSDADSSNGHGTIRNGFRIELFATTLRPDSWGPADVIELYSGRASLENRLAQEDREFNLGRTFSNNPAGQEWAWGVGLALWNWQVVTGFSKGPPSERLPPQAPRAAATALGATLATPSALVEATVPALPSEPDPSPRTTAAVRDDRGDPAPPPMPHSAPTPPTTHFRMDRVAGAPWRSTFADVLRTTFRDLVAEPDWSVDDDTLTLRCPKREHLIPYAVTKHPTQPMLYIRTPPNVCAGCPLEEACHPHGGRGVYKSVGRRIPMVDAPGIRDIVESLRRTRTARVHRPKATPRRSIAPVATAPREGGPWVHRPLPQCQGGTLRTQGPTFLPAEARHRARIPPGTIVIVPLDDRRASRRTRTLVAESSEARGHKRRTILQLRSRYESFP